MEPVGITAAVRDWLGRASTRLAILLVLVGFLFVLLEAQSASQLYFTGHQVDATSSGGIVYYRVNGEQWTLDDTRDSGSRDHRVTVFFDPKDPGAGLIDSPTRWIDTVGVFGWFAAALLCLLLAPVVRSRRRRAVRRKAASPVAGERDAEWFGQYLERSRRDRE